MTCQPFPVFKFTLATFKVFQAKRHDNTANCPARMTSGSSETTYMTVGQQESGIINCIAIVSKKGASDSNFFRKETFLAVLSKGEKTNIEAFLSLFHQFHYPQRSRRPKTKFLSCESGLEFMDRL